MAAIKAEITSAQSAGRERISSRQLQGQFDEYHPELGFDLGWDFARYGRFLDPEKVNGDVLAGYHAGKAHFQIAQHRPTRYQAKWLQLGLSAMRRRRIVHPDVTPECLQRIDYDVCAVTLQPLNQSTRAGTDWSVDRINNDGAYAPGNLMVISTLSNGAKGARITLRGDDRHSARLSRRSLYELRKTAGFRSIFCFSKSCCFRAPTWEQKPYRFHGRSPLGHIPLTRSVPMGERARGETA
jgi:hypothetical protein